MKAIKSDARPLDENTLRVICDTVEETRGVRILSCYAEHNDVYGIYINNAYDSLSFLGSANEQDILTEIDGHHLYFFELGFLMKGIYLYGAVHIYNTIMHESDISFDYQEEYQAILDLIRENPPLLQIALSISNDIALLNEDVSYEELNRLLDYINACKTIYDFGTYEMVSDRSGFVKAMNAMSALRQDLKTDDFDKVSEKKMNDINQLFVDLIVKVFILDRM